MTQRSEQPIDLVLLGGAWWKARKGGKGVGRVAEIFQPLLHATRAGSMPGVKIHIPLCIGSTPKQMAHSALENLYTRIPGLREGKVLLLVWAWSAGLHIARFMEELHGRPLWSSVGNLAGLAANGVEYPEFVGLLRHRAWPILSGLATNKLTWPAEAVAKDIFGTTVDGVPNKFAWMLDVGEQKAEPFWFVAGVFVAGLKELMAPRPFQHATLMTMIGTADPFVGRNVTYRGEYEQERFVLDGAPHGAHLIPDHRPDWGFKYEVWFESQVSVHRQRTAA